MARSANGSIKFELDASVFSHNVGLDLCPSVVESVIAESSALGCDVTYADVSQVVGAAAVFMAGGPKCRLLMGRPDKRTPDDDSSFPGPCGSAASIVASLAAMGFTNPLEATVVLSGSHTIGRSHVTFCNAERGRGRGPMTVNHTTFNNDYFKEVVHRRGEGGWFISDRAKMEPGAETAPLMERLAASNTLFISSWCPQYQEMR